MMMVVKMAGKRMLDAGGDDDNSSSSSNGERGEITNVVGVDMILRTTKTAITTTSHNIGSRIKRAIIDTGLMVSIIIIITMMATIRMKIVLKR